MLRAGRQNSEEEKEASVSNLSRIIIPFVLALGPCHHGLCCPIDTVFAYLELCNDDVRRRCTPAKDRANVGCKVHEWSVDREGTILP